MIIINVWFNTFVRTALELRYIQREHEDFSLNLAFRNFRYETFPSVKYADQKEKMFKAQLLKIEC